MIVQHLPAFVRQLTRSPPFVRRKRGILMFPSARSISVILFWRRIHTHDHCHFYQLLCAGLGGHYALCAEKADPETSAITDGVSSWHRAQRARFTKFRTRSGSCRQRSVGYFSPMAAGAPAMRDYRRRSADCGHPLSAEALECQRDANRVVALLGGKIAAYQNTAVGGVANRSSRHSGRWCPGRLMCIQSFIEPAERFVRRLYGGAGMRLLSGDGWARRRRGELP